jgi:protein involved in polysaccharide export with SLBB domain
MGRMFTVVAWVALSGLLSGCDGPFMNDFLDPGEPHIVSPGYDRTSPLVVPVLDTLASGIEEPSTAFAAATDIEPADLVPDISDYKIGPNDLLSVAIFDLLGEGTGEQVKTVRVTETGMISLTFIPPVKASGLTERELEQAVSKAYEDANLIRKARVSVTVSEARARTFSIQGNVATPGEYQITKPDFRMLDAMVTSHAPAVSIGVPYAYIIRKAAEPGAQPGVISPSAPSEPSAPQPNVPTTAPGDMFAPPPATPEAPPAPAPPATPEAPTTPAAPPTTPAAPPTPAPPATPEAPTTAPGNLLVPPPTNPAGPQGRASPPAPAQRTIAMDNVSSQVFKFDDVEAPTDMRIIRVPIDQLRQYGELKYNVVIRPGDMIIVPDPVTGVYYMGGHVLRPGVFSLTGVNVTLKQAWVAAGGGDGFAVPYRTEIIRRVGSNREVCIRVRLNAVLALEEPDVYLKPNDVVYVGTHFIAPFLAAVRNSFRISYGAAFSYDRNFYNGQNAF